MIHNIILYYVPIIFTWISYCFKNILKLTVGTIFDIDCWYIKSYRKISRVGIPNQKYGLPLKKNTKPK